MNKLHGKKVVGKWSADHLSINYQPPIPTNHLPTTYRPFTDHLLTTYQPLTNHLLTTYRPLTNHLPTTYWPHTNHLPTTYQPLTNHLPTTYQPLTDHLLTTYGPLTNHLPTMHLLTTYQPLINHLLTSFFTVQLVHDYWVNSWWLIALCQSKKWSLIRLERSNVHVTRFTQTSANILTRSTFVVF